jgi:hypothetical protein
LGVNITRLKKPAPDRLKVRFKRVDKEKDRWVIAPKKSKESKPPKGKGKPSLKPDVSDKGESCFATFKEQ